MTSDLPTFLIIVLSLHVCTDYLQTHRSTTIVGSDPWFWLPRVRSTRHGTRITRYFDLLSEAYFSLISSYVSVAALCCFAAGQVACIVSRLEDVLCTGFHSEYS
eukprot:COSAG05_NODE_3670_length_1916_cov_1.208586_3_plen_103_part_01